MPTEAPLVITDVQVERRRPSDAASHAAPRASLLPALRADLAPLAPSIRRAMTVVAAAAVADWALRTGTRAVVQEGLSALGRRGSGGERLGGGAGEVAPGASETLIVERVILHRSL